MFSKIFVAGLACTVPFVAAYTKPTGSSPSGNDLYTPGMNSIVPVGQPYEITWKPTTQGTVTLVLLKGPSSNAVPQYAIVENIANTGSYSWTPKTDLAPAQTGYGIELIDDTTGAYQYTTQFGISNDHQSASSNTTTTTSVPSGGVETTTTLSSPTETGETGAVSTAGPYGNETSTSTTTSAPVTVITSKPSGNSTSPAGLKTTTIAITSSKTSSSVTAAGTGAAATMVGSIAGLVLAAGVAVFAA